MSRLPIRLRLTLAVAATLAVVLGAVGAFVYARVQAEVDGQINDEQQDHVAAVASRLHRDDPRPRSGIDPLNAPGPEGTQVLDASGRLVRSTAAAGRRPLVDAAMLHRALAERRVGPVTDAGRRMIVVSGRFRGRTLVVVASTSLAQRNHALDRLAAQLVIGGLAGLLAAALVAYLIAGRAFRPFETMRRQAATISAAEPGGRLEVPRSDDELARLGRTLNEMLERLHRALEHERRFVAEASHELRTPLAVLRAELELARSRPRTRGELEAALDSVAEEADRLTRLADDLLLLARADEGVLQQRDEVEVAELLDEVAAAFSARARGLGRAMEVDAPGGVAVAGDSAALYRAVTNLVDNALRHGAGTIRLRAAERGEQVDLHVTDEGEGFPPGFLPVAFERFSRAGRAPDGAGLGLALVRAVAEAHGGAAEAGTSPDGGADVWLSLPRAPAPERPRTPVGV